MAMLKVGDLVVSHRHKGWIGEVLATSEHSPRTLVVQWYSDRGTLLDSEPESEETVVPFEDTV